METTKQVKEAQIYFQTARSYLPFEAIVKDHPVDPDKLTIGVKFRTGVDHTKGTQYWNYMELPIDSGIRLIESKAWILYSSILRNIVENKINPLPTDPHMEIASKYPEFEIVPGSNEEVQKHREYIENQGKRG